MAEIISLISVITIILLIITVPVDVRIYYEKKLKIDINFMLFGAHFSFPQKKERTKKRKIELSRLPALISSLAHSLSFLIGHSRVKLNKLSYTLSGDDYAAIIHRYSAVSAAISTAFAYLDTNAASFKSAVDTPDFSQNKDLDFDSFSLDVKFRLIFIHIPFAIAVFLFDFFRKNTKTRRKKNV